MRRSVDHENQQSSARRHRLGAGDKEPRTVRLPVKEANSVENECRRSIVLLP
jgi:hypothetical protein